MLRRVAMKEGHMLRATREMVCSAQASESVSIGGYQVGCMFV